jgi:hypothetical protein
MRVPKRLIPAICFTVCIGLLIAAVTGKLKGASQQISGVTNPAAVNREGVLFSSGANPRPNAGFPHGRGITLADLPHGYFLAGRPRPSFDDYVSGEPDLANERHFLRTCYLRKGENRCLWAPQNTNPIRVAPGDRLLISALIDNNGSPNGNDDGKGPAVARDSRISFNFPNEVGRELNLGGFIYARNTIVDETRTRLKTISDNLAFRSATGMPFAFRFQHEARFLCANSFDPSNPVGRRYLYTAWPLTSAQQYWMFTGESRNTMANPEESFGLGLPIGSGGRHRGSHGRVGGRQREQLRFYAGSRHHCFLQFTLQVLGRWQKDAGRYRRNPSHETKSAVH